MDDCLYMINSSRSNLVSRSTGFLNLRKTESGNGLESIVLVSGAEAGFSATGSGVSIAAGLSAGNIQPIFFGAALCEFIGFLNNWIFWARGFSIFD
jgi:hypothetical protein